MFSKVRKEVSKLKTPFYIYDSLKVKNNISILKTAFPSINTRLYYAVKANSSVYLLKFIRKQGAAAEVVSAGEIYLCLLAGFKPENIMYNSIARKEEDVIYALKQGVLFFNFEAIDQATLLEKCAREQRKHIKLFVRLNPAIFAGTHTHLSTGAPLSKFGIEENEISLIAKLSKKFKYAKITGIHSHIGSQILASSPFIKAAKNAARVLRIFKKANIRTDYLNLGGGFGIPYENNDKELKLNQVSEAYNKIAQKYNLRLLIEPGRFIVGNAGYIVTRVISIKKRSGTILYIIDAGMTENPRPAIYRAHHHIQLLTKKKGKKVKSRITGPLCENSNEFGTYSLPQLEIGDCLVIENCGAYTRTMGSNYNGRLLAAEYFYANGKIRNIRKKQEFKNLRENEKY